MLIFTQVAKCYPFRIWPEPSRAANDGHSFFARTSFRTRNTGAPPGSAQLLGGEDYPANSRTQRPYPPCGGRAALCVPARDGARDGPEICDPAIGFNFFRWLRKSCCRRFSRSRFVTTLGRGFAGSGRHDTQSTEGEKIMALVLFKATLLFMLALGCLPFLRRASSVTRHLICACAMAGAQLL